MHGVPSTNCSPSITVCLMQEIAVWRIAIYVGCCVAGVLVTLAFVINFSLW